MPDFERVFDDLSLSLAKTPEEKARAEGFIAGKKYARKEILATIIVLFVVIFIGWQSWIAF